MTFKDFEKFAIVLVVVLGLVFIGHRYFDTAAAVASAKVEAAQKVLAQQEQANATIAAQTAAQQAQYASMVESLTKQNQSLSAAIAANNAALSKQQAANQTLPLPDLANRWKALGNLGNSDIAATTTGITVTDQGARATVNQLERVPVLQTTVDGLTTVSANKDSQIAGLNTLITGKDSLIVGLNKQLKDGDDVCTAKVKDLKVQQRKKSRNWFAAGFVSGFITKLLLP